MYQTNIEELVNNTMYNLKQIPLLSLQNVMDTRLSKYVLLSVVNYAHKHFGKESATEEKIT